MSSMIAEQIEAAESEWWQRYREGPRRTRWETMPIQPGDPAPDLELVDQTGRPTRLSDTWSTGPALVIFWRHFGCGCGMERAARLRDEHDSYVAAGANVVIVGQGEPERTRAYAEAQSIPAPILCDPYERAYEAYGLLEGTVSQILFDAPDEFLRRELEAGQGLVAKRRELGRPLVDNPWLLPGEFVVDAGGALSHAHRYQHCEDFPNPLVLAAAIRETSGFAAV